MIYIINVSEIDGVYIELSQYRRDKAERKKNKGARLLCLASGILTDYALRQYKLCEKNMEYGENEHGKPYFKNRPDIKFNISDSGCFAACVFSENNVGIDIEEIKTDRDILKTARKYFTEKEYEHIKAQENQYEEFFRLWTRKEALLKAAGTGIAGGLKNIDVLKDSVEFLGKRFYLTDFSGSISNFKACVCSENSPIGAENIKLLTREDIEELKNK